MILFNLKSYTTLFIVSFFVCQAKVNQTLKKEAKQYLKYLDVAVCQWQHQGQLVDFNYEFNVTDENLKIKEAFHDKPKGIVYKQFPWNDFGDPDMPRQIMYYDLIAPKDPNVDKAENKKDAVVNKMIAIFSQVTVCNYTDPTACDLHYYPELGDIFVNSNDPEELKFYWLSFMNKLGPEIKPLYSDYVKLANDYAHISDYSNYAYLWLDEYEEPPIDKFKDYMIGLWEELKPLYLQLFTFVRKQLFDIYGGDVVNRTGPLPIHLLGSINGIGLDLIVDKIKPFRNKHPIDITPQLVKQNITVRDMAKICEDFYKSLGMPALPESFWKKSLFEEPTDRVSSCFASAWDMCDRKDYRMLVCGRPTMDDLFSFCHEIGHVQNYMAYEKQPCCYHKAPNDGMGEGWADTASLSISSTERLGRLGFLEDPCNTDKEVELNKLFYDAVLKVAFQPFGLIVDLWRWDLFEGNISDDNWNKVWWDMRLNFQGVIPPEPRSEQYLDPVSKSHIISDDQYIIYFLAHLFQFQFHEALCITAGEFDPDDPNSKPLNQCDIYGSKAAGKKALDMLSMGPSKPWPYALEKITGQRELSSKPLLNYFKPLQLWLEEENKRTGEYIGW